MKKRHEKTFWDDGYICYLDGGDSFAGVYICQLYKGIFKCVQYSILNF